MGPGIVGCDPFQGCTHGGGKAAVGTRTGGRCRARTLGSGFTLVRRLAARRMGGSD